MSTKNFRVSDGDWICPDKKCGNVNFARRTSCNRCGREKTTEAKMMKAGGTEIGKTLAEKSRGLFSANDWQCKTCGNVNWARRSECNMCNTPKYAKLEERTGYGGGFNERENVEYIEREESDGEYDEFGRKKKKYRGKPVGPASILKEVEDKESEAEEDEDEDEDLSKYKLDEDEDEDDADLSKYNLDASEEEDANKKKKSDRRSPIQEALPVPDQDLVPVPENILDLVGRNQDPAPGPTGGLQPQEKDLTQALVHRLLLREAGSEVVLDLRRLVIAKKDDRDHGHPKDAAGHHLDLPTLVPVQVLKRNSILKFTFKTKFQSSA
ncbi:zinc finger Ran-binding domain-containing protein 2 [Alligator mississippiensis]|uniref:Zinc finger Ran-binding domain-containing protein 2 n=1 Tax=Alligator mississippiensis TaxID=8496 RepID=A0A151NJ87_ALLMI|nr:zinc finger Ran-binding domain-containing protein 2 [Alligator mississippiensis]